jgi:L-ribulose-5-phosphate 3-epimerase
MGLEIGALTDEFSPTDLGRALHAMAGLGMTFADLRVVFGRNIVDLTDAEVDRASAMVRAAGLRVLSIASPVLKCTLPDAPALDGYIQQDIFGSSYGFEDQPRLASRAFDIARRTGAAVIRVFSYWRTVDPGACFERVASALSALAHEASERGLVLGIENEHACNIATGVETGRLLAAIPQPALQVVWDPANALLAGESPYPDGYSRVPAARIAHVHAKDCRLENRLPVFGPLGEMDVDWRGQIRALVRDGYRGAISLETHWKGPGGDKFQGSMICGASLRALVRSASEDDHVQG